MASQSQGVQQLLKAESKAGEKVAEARKRKARRLKQAKEEAEEEINKYRLERERQFKEFEAKHMGSSEDVSAKIQADTDIRINEMKKAVQKNKEKVIEEILDLVCDIKPELHVNFQNLKA